MDADEVQRGMRVLFWPDFMKAGEVNELVTGKVKGAVIQSSHICS